MESLRKVTPLSKLLALILFIIFPFVGFLIGMQYERAMNKNNSVVETPIVPDETVVCTLDAKICPDGSSVGRVPPTCEFTPCPGEI